MLFYPDIIGLSIVKYVEISQGRNGYEYHSVVSHKKINDFQHFF